MFCFLVQVANFTPNAAESEVKHLHCWPHCVSLSIPCHETTDVNLPASPIGPAQAIFMRPHPVKQFTDYRLWNPVSKQNDGLIQRNSFNIVTCNGSFSGGSESKCPCFVYNWHERVPTPSLPSSSRDPLRSFAIAKHYAKLLHNVNYFYHKCYLVSGK